jgi:hypothetical protein
VTDAEIDDGWVKGSIPGPGGRTYEIEHHLVPRTANQPFLRLELSPPNLVLHTTEGTSVDGAISTLTAKFSPSQWIVGEHRIVQTRPLWAQGAAVDTENGKAMQIEMVAKSNLALWLPDDPSLHPLVALVAFLAREKLIAHLTRHAKLAALPLVLDKGPQAKDTYYRRHLGAWPAPGVYGHVDLPNDEHWDPGSFDYPGFFEMVLEVQGGDDEDVSVDELLAGMRRRIGRKGAPAADAPKHTQEGWKVADEIFDALAEAGTPAAPAAVSGGVPEHEHEATIGKVKKKP